jgi:glycosyltransferase involved in cell wall biosynthesis
MHPRTDIAIFLPSLAGGGAERIMVDLSSRFHDLGYKVDLVLCNYQGPLNCNVESGVKVVNLVKSKPRKAIFSLSKYLREKRPTVILSTLTHANIACALAWIISNSSSNLVLCEQIDVKYCLSEIYSPFDAWITRKLIRFLYPRAYKIITSSNGATSSLSEISGIDFEQIETIYNFTDTQRLSILSKQTVDLPWKDSAPILLAAGRLTYQKDFLCLLDAFTILRNKHPAHLIILGEGEEKHLLEERAKILGISRDVWLPGFTENPYKYMAHADMFILSSRFEGFAIVLIEALALNLPIVSTQCPSGPDEVLNGGEYGLLVSVGDSVALAEAMIKSLLGKTPNF